MVAETKGTRMNTKAIAVAACLWLPVAASAAADQSEKIDTLAKRFERLMATQGISVGGKFRGMYGGAEFSGNSLDKSRRNDEQIGYTSVDFDLRAKPNTETQARAIFRMHMDHASFFGSPYTPLETRWLSIDGGALDGMLYYHLGNMLQKWSPLTMWAPEVGYLYTPRIFAQAQSTAMDERFLGNNNRNLQGVNVGFRAAVPPAHIDSFNVSLLAARLLMGAPLGSPATDNPFTSGAAVNKKGDVNGWPSVLANYDRILLGGRANVAFLGGMQASFNFLQNKDLKSTFGVTDTSAQVSKVTTSIPGTPDTIIYPAARPKDSLLTSGIVMGGQLQVDGSKLLASKSLILGLDAEFARSSWDYFVHTEVAPFTTDVSVDSTNPLLPKTTRSENGAMDPVYEAKAGIALNLGLKAGWKGEAWSAALRGGYLMNDSLFRSDLAQTPVFRKNLGRIYNSEQDVYDLATSSYVRPKHYNLFDAMYNNVHHWIAEEKNEYSKNAYDKLAYTNYVAGSNQNPFSNLTAFLPVLKRAVDTGIVRYASAKIGLDTTLNKYMLKVDSVKALVIKTSTDSVSLGLKRATAATLAQRLYTDSAVNLKSVEYKKNVDASYITNVRATKTALYQMALDGYELDRDMQYVLPGGEASANRVGPKVGLDAQYSNGGVEITSNVYMLQEAKGTIMDSLNQIAATKAKFQSIEAGLRVRGDKFFPNWNTLLKPKAPLPLEVSVSFAQSSTKGGLYLDYASQQIGASAYVGVVPRLSVLAGFQQVKGDDKTLLEIDRNYSNIAGGLEFKIQDGAYFLAQYNLLKTEYPNATEFDFTQDVWSTKISVIF